MTDKQEKQKKKELLLDSIRMQVLLLLSQMHLKIPRSA